MLIVRPARLSDLDALERMARAAHPVLHSLPRDRGVLETRVALSEDSFRADVDFPGEEFYLFVLEETRTQALLGTSSIVASVKEVGSAGEVSLAVADDRHEGAAAVVVLLDSTGKVLDRRTTSVGESA